MSKAYVRVADAERLRAEGVDRLAEIEAGLCQRIAARIAAGEDPRIAAAAEVHLALAQLHAADAAVRKALAAVTIYPEAPAQ